MKKLISILAAVLLAAPLTAMAQIPSYTNVAQAGVSFFSASPATGTFVSGPVKLPTYSGTGVLTVTGAGITGSPSGCTVALAYRGNNSSTSVTVSTTSFTPSTGVQTFNITPSALSGDNYVATYACTTYPTAGTVTASFSPITPVSADPCYASNKSTASISITTATTTALVPAVAGKVVYICGLTATVGASSTIAFEYGTGATCGTGTTVTTGAFTPATGGILSLNGEGTKLLAPAGNALCAVTTGTGGIYGVINYTQQ